jgi:signal transduction histidine kinase
MNDAGIQSLILAASILITCIAGFVIYFVVLYKNKQLANIREKEQLKSAFRHEVLKTQIEVQEQTFIYVSREIHDNITQVLSFVKLNLGIIDKSAEEQKQAKIMESRELIAQVINDLRDLSKSLSFEYITTLGLVKTITIEKERINKSGILDVELEIKGDVYSLGEQRELVLFRIFQEALNNTLKYSGASHLKIALTYNPELFTLTVEDNGCGFVAAAPGNHTGSGLRNIENRAALIGAAATIDSSPGNGCCINVTLNPSEQHIY